MNRLQRAAFKLGLPPLHRVTPRRAQLYCVGAAKSGTNSIAGVFEDRMRALHEPESDRLMSILFGHFAGAVDRDELTRFLRERDRRLWLEVDSSQLNYFVLDLLLDEFPDAKFLLTIRDCYSWLDSMINQSLTRPTPPAWRRLRDVRFRPGDFRHSAEEKVLAERGLYTLDGYLSYWAAHNATVLRRVPREKLLVVRTDRISQSVRHIADFAGVPLAKLNLRKAHSFKNEEFRGVVSMIAPRFLEEKVSMHCREIMQAYFPDIRSALDVAASHKTVHVC
jgi:hypothetical protein